MLRLVLVIVRLALEVCEIGFYPRYALVEPLVQRNSILPTQVLAQLRAIEHISGILAQAFADNLDAVFKFCAQLCHDGSNQLPDSDDLIGRDVISLAGWRAFGDAPSRIRYIPHVDKRPLRKTATMELQLAAQHHV